ncbi:MAG: YbhB/YbcL family Raf kinase inhibitor-like protein [Actinobacteria bacterium]|nr:YbhB/YbcL family Raf kinase inhibitor-like protein [Actinomycetota bacterium]
MNTTNTTSRLVAVSIAAAVALSACSTDGSDLTAPGTNGATPVPIVIPTEPEPLLSEDTLTFTLVSPEFEASGSIPAVFSRRDGDNVSPPLQWGGVPEGTTDLALVMTDPSANGFVHWVIWGLDPVSIGLDIGQVPPEARQALNGFGDAAYGGPSPPPGADPHVYLWRLFALDQPTLDLENGMNGQDAIAEIESRAIAITELIAFYG